MEISRVFTRRGGEHSEAGTVGTATLTVPDGPWTLRVVGPDGTLIGAGTLADIIRDAMVEQALSPLTDSYAGTNAIADAQAAFADKAKRLLNGEYKTRSGGGGVDPVTVQIRQIVAGLIKDADKSREEKAWPALDAMETAERNAALDEKFAAQPKKVRETITAQAEARVEENRAAAAKRAEAKAALAKATTGF